MTRYVVDASIVMKWVVPETGSERAAGLLQEGVHLLAPDLLWAECGNVVWKKFRRRELTRGEARAVLDRLGEAPIIIRPLAPLLPAAFEIAAETDRTVYDALYLALARVERCPLVTADERLRHAVQKGPFGANVLGLGDLPG